MCILPITAGAQDGADVSTENYGVSGQGSGAVAPRTGTNNSALPEPDHGYVTDLASVLTDEEEDAIEQRLWRVEYETGVEVAVLTIDTINDYLESGALSIEEFAAAVFNDWGIGNMPENEGVLLVLAVRDRQARIELGAGFGRYRDGDARDIMDDTLVPNFRAGDYVAGLTEGVEEIAYEFASVRFGTDWRIVGLLIAIPIVILIAISLFRSGKRGWGWATVGLGIVIVLVLLRTIWQVASALPSTRSSGWSSGGFGGGFGGGFSGGGGATGSW